MNREKRVHKKSKKQSDKKKKKTVRPRWREKCAVMKAAGGPSKVSSLTILTGTSVTLTTAISMECDGSRLRKVMEVAKIREPKGRHCFQKV